MKIEQDVPKMERARSPHHASCLDLPGIEEPVETLTG
jgi:hypothetical protein